LAREQGRSDQSPLPAGELNADNNIIKYRIFKNNLCTDISGPARYQNLFTVVYNILI